MASDRLRIPCARPHLPWTSAPCVHARQSCRVLMQYPAPDVSAPFSPRPQDSRHSIARFDFLDINQVRYLVDHTPVAPCVRHHDTLMHPSESKSTHARTMVRQATIDAPLECDFQHGPWPLRSHRSAPQCFYVDSALRRNLLSRPHFLQPANRCSNYIYWIVGPDAFREHVLHAQNFKHRAHRPTCNYSRSFRRRMHVNPRRAMSCHQRILHRTAFQRHPHKITTCALHSLLNCRRYFPCFSTTHPHSTLAVTHDRKRRKPEQTSALHYFRYAVDRYKLL